MARCQLAIIPPEPLDRRIAAGLSLQVALRAKFRRGGCFGEKKWLILK
jgi:hypothetical protein